jgi:hypothetical protein
MKKRVESVTLKPNMLVRQISTGEILETISMPYPMSDKDLGKGEAIKGRSPGNPTTVATYEVSDLLVVQVRCERDATVWHAMVKGELKRCHIYCPTCHRGYYAEYDGSGRFLRFNSDRILTIL